MNSLLHSLLLDLKRRGQFVLKELGALETTLPANFGKHRTETVDRIQRAIVMVDNMLNDPDLANPHLEPNFFIDFKRFSELILNIEDMSLLILKRCSPEDRFLSGLLKQICEAVKYPDPSPLMRSFELSVFSGADGDGHNHDAADTGGRFASLAGPLPRAGTLCCLSAEIHTGCPAAWLNQQILCRFTSEGATAGTAGGVAQKHRGELHFMGWFLACGVRLRHGGDLLVRANVRVGESSAKRNAWGSVPGQRHASSR